jgi:hypothetical protein
MEKCMAIKMKDVRERLQKEILDDVEFVNRTVQGFEQHIDGYIAHYAKGNSKIEISLVSLSAVPEPKRSEIVNRLIAIYSAPDVGWKVEHNQIGTMFYLVFSGHLDKPLDDSNKSFVNNLH